MCGCSPSSVTYCTDKLTLFNMPAPLHHLDGVADGLDSSRRSQLPMRELVARPQTQRIRGSIR
eukprot:5596943-Pyramimonas_sp.AAC.2